MSQWVKHCKKSAFDVYIGRPSAWGNPFIIGRDGDRSNVIRLYSSWLMSKPDLVERARKELRGKVLGCWCAPSACHGDVLSKMSNGG